jgi:hypothetical protein
MKKDELEKRVWFLGWAEALAQEPWPQAQRGRLGSSSLGIGTSARGGDGR